MSDTHSPARVTPHSFLTLHYRLGGPHGDIINTFTGKPATMSLGEGRLSPLLEEKLLGLEEGAHTVLELAEGEADVVWITRQAAWQQVQGQLQQRGFHGQALGAPYRDRIIFTVQPLAGPDPAAGG